MDPAKLDYEAEGLLKGCLEADRDDRRTLIDELLADGVSLEEVKAAVATDQLAHLGVRRALAGRPVYTAREAAHETGLELDFVLSVRRALGHGRCDPDFRTLSDNDVEALRLLRNLVGAGLPAEGLVDLVRLLSQGLTAAADAARGLVGRPVVIGGSSERDIVQRQGRLLDATLPYTAPLLAYVLRQRLLLLEQDEVAGLSEMRAADRVPGSRHIAVCFADIVGFTPLGEKLSIAALRDLVARLERTAGEVVEPPVRLVKTIGDAVMLVCEDATALVENALELVEAVETEAGFPPLRAGVACGTAINRSGDWFGAPVNRASRLTSVAPSGGVVCDAGVRDALRSSLAVVELETQTLKGFDAPVAAFAVYRPGRKSPTGPARAAPP